MPILMVKDDANIGWTEILLLYTKKDKADKWNVYLFNVQY